MSFRNYRRINAIRIRNCCMENGQRVWVKMLRYRIVAKYNVQSNVAMFELKDAVASEIQKKVI
jgi:hypothetical protein